MGGYGGPDTCSSIVHPAVTMVSPDGSMRSGPAMTGMVLAVDMAVSADGKRVAFVSAGNATNDGCREARASALPRVFMSDTDSTTDPKVGLPARRQARPLPASSAFDGTRHGRHPPPAVRRTTGSTGASCGVPDPEVPQVVGRADRGRVRRRRHAGRPVARAGDAGARPRRQPRSRCPTESRADTGHLIFHANAGGNLACASCHAEGNDDGRVWNFTCEGARRTQSLHTGLRGTEPFHWSGNEADIGRLMDDVFVGRMSGPIAGDRPGRHAADVDRQPAAAAATGAAANRDAVARGRTLFNDPQRGACASCHSGAGFTNNQTVDVGTGGAFQVPSLVGIGSRGPFMHDGCAKTLADRFGGACGGGDRHGFTSTMTGAEISRPGRVPEQHLDNDDGGRHGVGQAGKRVRAGCC